MQPTEAGTTPRYGRPLTSAADRERRFDGESARRILERAAAQQQRLDTELADSWSFDELEQVAAEAGISSEVLRAAVDAHSRSPGLGTDTTALAADERIRRRRSGVRRLIPWNWSRTGEGVVLAAAGIAVFAGLLLAFPAFAELVFWMLLLILVVLSVLIFLGASPF